MITPTRGLIFETFETLPHFGRKIFPPTSILCANKKFLPPLPEQKKQGKKQAS